MRNPYFFSRDWDRRERRLDWLAEALDRWHKKWFSDKAPEEPKLPLVRPMPGLNFEDRRRIVTDFLGAVKLSATEIGCQNSAVTDVQSKIVG